MDSSGNKPFKSALKVNEGIAQPSSVNVGAVQQYSKPGRKLLPAEQYVEGILSGNRTILSQAITLIESALPLHQQTAQAIIGQCLPLSGNSVRIGITGVPGVGKSTFIEAYGKHLTAQGRMIAVLAIDPSSSRSRGSILGDKTRMEELSIDSHAFIRPSPAAGSLGGVARKTRETIILCEAAGFDTILVETVGVGQSEIAVHSMVDFFLLLMLGGAGDELQGIKRGISRQYCYGRTPQCIALFSPNRIRLDAPLRSMLLAHQIGYPEDRGNDSSIYGIYKIERILRKAASATVETNYDHCY